MEEGFILAYDFRGLSLWSSSIAVVSGVAELLTSLHSGSREKMSVTGLLPTPLLSHLAPGLLAAAAHGKGRSLLLVNSLETQKLHSN